LYYNSILLLTRCSTSFDYFNRWLDPLVDGWNDGADRH
jgi:hypothetical protein